MPPLSTFIVERADGEKVWTTVKGVAAWCSMSEVVRVNEGIDYFTDVIRKDAKHAYPFAARAMIYTELNHDYDRALADLDQAIELSPKNPALYQSRGYINQQKKDYDNAIGDYTKLLDFNPRSAATYQARGRCYKEKRELDKAIADYTSALKIEPNAIDFLNDRGIAYYATRQDDKAIADYPCSILTAAHDPFFRRLKLFISCDLGRLMPTFPHWK